MSDSSVTVIHNAEQQRYEILDGETVVGSTRYHPDGGVQLVFDSTEIDSAYSGQGLASTLVTFALDDVRARGKRVVAICSYVDRFISKHPEYQDLAD